MTGSQPAKRLNSIGQSQMLSKTDFDVIIVGVGPAGSTAAYLLKKQGLDILIIDKEKFPRTKLCGGLLTYKTLKILNKLYGETLQTLKDKGVINYISYSYELKTQSETWNAGYTAIPAVLVDRTVYDNYLLNYSINIGVETLFGDRVVDVDPINKIITTTHGKKLKAKIIIGADGVNSVVRKAIGKPIYDSKKWKRNLATGLEVIIPKTDVNLEVSGPMIYFDIVPWGYGWIFPNNNNLVVGVGCLSPQKLNLSGQLDKMLATLQFSGLKQKKLGHPIPYGNFLKNPASGNILLIGDAAGFVDPLMGEGIYYAHRSAEIAANSIRYTFEINSEARLAEIYIKSVRKNIISELNAIKKLRWLIFSAMDIFGIKALKFIISIVGIQRFTELIHGIRSFTWKRGRDYGN